MQTVFIAIQIVVILLAFRAVIELAQGNATYEQKLMIIFLIEGIVQNSAYIFELTATSLDAALVAIKMEYSGSCLIPTIYLIFISHYCHRDLKLVWQRLLLFWDCVVIALAWMPQKYHLFYKDITFVEDEVLSHVEITRGFGFMLFMVGCVAIPWMIALYIEVSSYIQAQQQKKKNILGLIIALTLCTFAVMALYIIGLVPYGYDPSPVALLLLLSLMVIVIWYKRDFNLVHVASDVVVDTLQNAIVTFNEQKEVVKYNQYAQELFPELKKDQSVYDVKGFPLEVFESNKKVTSSIADLNFECVLHELKDFDEDVVGFVVMMNDVTETYRYIEEMKLMRQKAEDANRAKSDFLANMSHEIRTPMNAIVGMSELVIEESRGRKVYDYACNIKAAAMNLLSVINDILDFSKVEAGKMELVEDAYRVKTLADDVVEMMRIVAAQKGLHLHLELDESVPSQLEGDVGRLRQVLVNLMNNAVKYTKKGDITLRVIGKRFEDTKDDEIVLQFEVEDTGVGMKEEDLKVIFDAFQQVDMSKKREIEGTGLGLAITKRLIHLMHGTIQVESEYGVGSKFTVRFKQKIVDAKPIGDVLEQEAVANIVDTRKFKAPNISVLVVDDNRVNREIACAMLKTYQVKIDQAQSGQQSIDMIKENSYDIVFMDHMMPEMDGVEAVGEIRKLSQITDEYPVIIALTANAINGAKEMYLTNGFQDFLAKPFQKSELLEVLAKWIPEEEKVYEE